MQWRSERGQAIAELAVGLPVLLLLLSAITQLPPVYNNWETLTDASRAGARVAAESRTDTNPAQDAKTAVVKSAADLDVSKLTVDTSSTWAPGSNVTVCAHYPYSISVLSVVLSSGSLDSCTTQLVQ